MQKVIENPTIPSTVNIRVYIFHEIYIHIMFVITISMFVFDSL